MMLIEIALQGHTFKAQGEFTLDAQFNVALAQFINAIDDQPGQVQALADTLNAQSDALQAVVDAHTALLAKEKSHGA